MIKHSHLGIMTILALSVFINAAEAKTINVGGSVGKQIELGPVRSPCEGGDVPSKATLKSWTVSQPKLGSLQYGPVYKRKSKVCKGKTLWMKKLYYLPNKTGLDTVSIRFPDAGLITWKIETK